tara:strand:+ start:481 stop:663 length:183 start_codon:yes stop_codon:yes gene_type:complete
MEKTLAIHLQEQRDYFVHLLEQRSVNSKSIVDARGLRIAADIIAGRKEQPRTIINENAIR